MIDLHEYFITRRTVRSFDASRVPNNTLLESLLEEASHAPTTGNMQLYSVVITRDPERHAAIAPAHFCQPASTDPGAVLLTFCADVNRFSRWCQLRDAEPGFDNLQSLLAAIFDTVIFAQQFNTAAEARGLGCCYLGTTTYNAAAIAEALELPDLVVPVLTLAVGYPKGETEVSDRLAPRAFVHNETYRRDSDADILSFFAEKEAREDSHRFVAENSKQTLAQVFTDVRYPKATSEAFSETFRAYLAAKGFTL